MIYRGENIYTVYIHTNKINNKRYVGITRVKPSERWKKNGRGYKNNHHFWNSIQKYGWDNFEHEIIANNITHEEAKNFETKLIALLNTQSPHCGYNISKGGDGGGYEISKSTRKKMSRARKGKYTGINNPMFGRSPSERMDKNTYEKWLYKHTHAKELGIKFTSKKIICITTNEIFESIAEASRKYNIMHSDISSCCNRKLCSAGRCPITGDSMIWQFYDDYESNITPKENTCFKRVVCYNTGEVFDNIVMASKKYNVPASNITLCCQRKYARAGKLTDTNEEIIWQYLDDYNNGVSPVEKKNNGISVKCINTGEIFKSLKEAARHFGIKDCDGIKKCCEGVYKRSGKHPVTHERLKWIFI